MTPTTPSTDLLRSLAAGIRPMPHAAGASTPVGPLAPHELARSDFAALLGRAKGLASDRPVTVAKDAKVSLTDDQLSRLAQAADHAEAQGANRALVRIDDQWLTLDVATRTITGVFDPVHAQASAGPSVLTGLDAVIHVPGAANSPARALGRADHNATLLPDNPSLRGLLARRDH